MVGRSGTLYFGGADGAVQLYRPDGDYAVLAGAGEATSFDGYAVRTLRPPGAGTPPSIVAAFVARIEAGDTGTLSLDIQAHVLEIIARAYECADAGQPVAPNARF